MDGDEFVVVVFALLVTVVGENVTLWGEVELLESVS